MAVAVEQLLSSISVDRTTSLAECIMAKPPMNASLLVRRTR